MLPFLEQSLGLLDQFLAASISRRAQGGAADVATDPLLARFNDVLVGLEERTNVQGLAPPHVAVDGPVEGELEGASVEGAGGASVELAGGSGGRGRAQHDGLVARHGCRGRDEAHAAAGDGGGGAWGGRRGG